MKNYKKIWKLGAKEFHTEYLNINNDGELVIREGNFQYNVHDLARIYGPSVKIHIPYILEKRLERLFDAAEAGIKKAKYKGKFSYFFPMKVNQHKDYLMTLVSEGAHLEVASYNHLWIVKKIWENENFHSKIRVVSNGPKSEEYIALIKEMRKKGMVIIPIIEAMDEVEKLKGFSGDVGVRVNLKAKVKSYWDKKIDRFGLDAEEIFSIGKIKNLKILHYHMGSQIQRECDFILALEEAFKVYKRLKMENSGLDTINIGGGFALPYEGKKMYSVESLLSRIFRRLKVLCDKDNVPHPNLITEWGWYITGPAEMTVYRIMASKDIPKGVAKKWYMIEGSFMNDLLDTWAIKQKWHIVPVNDLKFKKRQRVWLAGISCDSDDKYTSNNGYLLLPALEDLNKDESLYLAVLDTGGYEDSFSAHHCMLSAPTRLILEDGTVTIRKTRETAEEVAQKFGW